jgi:hypothetical protein
MSDYQPYFPMAIAIIVFAGIFAGIYIDHRLARKRENIARDAAATISGLSKET